MSTPEVDKILARMDARSKEIRQYEATLRDLYNDQERDRQKLKLECAS